MDEHSLLPPSSAWRRMVCPGSRALELVAPEGYSNDSAVEGTLAHEIAANLLREDKPDTIPDFEMGEHISFYVDYVNELCNFPENALYVEEKTRIQKVHPECFGTPDAWFSKENENYDIVELHIFDFKYGFTPVEAFENWQLIAYASGILYNKACIDDRPKIIFHIIQPRDYKNKIKTWEITYDEFLKYEADLIASEQASLQPNAPLIPGDGCKHCKARSICGALRNMTLSILDVQGKETVNLSNEELGNELRDLKTHVALLDARITGLEEQVIHKLIGGVQVPHFKLGVVQSREVWCVSDEVLCCLEAAFNAELFKKTPVTPNQAIKAGVPEEIVKKHTMRPMGALKLIEVKEKNIKRIFKK